MFGVAIVNLVVLIFGIYIARIFLRKKNPLPLPPGPRPKPIIGNITDLPPPGEQEWQHWFKHKDLYGPISSVTVLGQTIIILNDSEATFELLEKRSAIYSSRPRMVFGGEMVGWENSLVSQTYSNRFRAYRKNVHTVFGTKSAMARFNPLINIEVRRFLLRILEKPEDFIQHSRTQAGAIILKISYGYTIEPQKRDPLVDLADEALVQFTRAASPGTWIVDIFPYLKYLPDWLPGTGFKRTASHWRKTLTDLAEKPYEFVRQQMAKGKYESSYLSKLLEKSNLSSEEEFVAKWSALSLYSGGADTTVSSVKSFFLAMILYPEVQRKAQEEIDNVVGTGRLPTSADREILLYVDAIVKEVLRWHPVVPMGVPHTTTSDDSFNGYHIPKGAMILPNIWAFIHDPKVFHDPMTFKPERFLRSEGHDPEPDPHTFSFGFGRRICPGRILADDSLYLTIAQTLAVFNISKVVDNGKETDPKVHFQPGVISHPVSFDAAIKPRSQDHVTLIRSVALEHPWQESDAKFL